MKNPHAVALGKLGGSVSTPKKAKANKEKIEAYWASPAGRKKRKKGIDTQSA